MEVELMEFNWTGIWVAVFSYVIIGIFHPLVIKAHYHFTENIWPVFLVSGVLLLGGSLFVPVTASILFSITGAACLWSIRELKEQTERVEKGWSPKNPKHSHKSV
jgi:hypothetical protein